MNRLEKAQLSRMKKVNYAEIAKIKNMIKEKEEAAETLPPADRKIGGKWERMSKEVNDLTGVYDCLVEVKNALRDL